MIVVSSAPTTPEQQEHVSPLKTGAPSERQLAVHCPPPKVPWQKPLVQSEPLVQEEPSAVLPCVQVGASVRRRDKWLPERREAADTTVAAHSTAKAAKTKWAVFILQ